MHLAKTASWLAAVLAFVATASPAGLTTSLAARDPEHSPAGFLSPLAVRSSMHIPLGSISPLVARNLEQPTLRPDTLESRDMGKDVAVAELHVAAGKLQARANMFEYSAPSTPSGGHSSRGPTRSRSGRQSSAPPGWPRGGEGGATRRGQRSRSQDPALDRRPSSPECCPARSNRGVVAPGQQDRPRPADDGFWGPAGFCVTACCGIIIAAGAATVCHLAS